jgi:membrane protein implicated in regulation of membrane protease activity
MVVLFVATGVVVAAVAALALQSWVLLVVVLALHAVVSTLVVVMAWRKAGDTRDKPDPVTEARIEEESGADSDRYPSGSAPSTSRGAS